MLEAFDPVRGAALFTSDSLRQLERAHPGGRLMAHAGASAARLARALWPHARRLAVVCGPGNNGGDGLFAATLLRAQGVSVQVIGVGHSTAPSAARRDAEAAWSAPVDPIGDLDPHADGVIDALLGIGMRGTPSAALGEAIAALNAHVAPVLGLDLPSGLLADTGGAPGAVVRCEHTLSMLAPTPGLFTGLGREFAGQIWLDDLGCPRSLVNAIARAGADRSAWWRHAPRQRSPHTAHKGHAGQVWVFQGPARMSGAARLAARAALCAGAGRVYLSGTPSASDAIWPELMQADIGVTMAGLAQGVAVAGCGGGEEVADWMEACLRQAAQLVLDADGLNAVASSQALRRQLARRRRQGQRSVLTPHPLEAARLLGVSTADVQADRLRAALALADQLQCVVVLKGSGTVIAAPDGRLQVNTSGNASLATAGTGDVLAGWLGGLLAQAPAAPLEELAAIACAWHGDAADQQRAGRGPLCAADLIAAMAALPG